MKKQQIVISTAVILMMLHSSVGGIEADNTVDSDHPNVHIINNVSYVFQEEGIYCSPATVEMLLEYYGFNTSQTEIMYYLGGGYSLGYPFRLSKIISNHIKPPYTFDIWPGWAITQGTGDKKFLANLFGCNAEHIMPDRIINHLKTWNDYWKTIKDYIVRDVPVMTSVDPLSWPLYMEIKNMSRIPIFNKGGHCILLVGFNENNRTVCFHDAYAGYKGLSEKGEYQWVSIKDFRRSLRRSTGDCQKYNSYEIITIEKVSEPIPKRIAFQIAHNRNIKRLKGIRSEYDEDYMQKNFERFGIKAVEKLKNDLSSGVILKRIPYYKLMITLSGGWLPFGEIGYFYETEAELKQKISDYILETAKDMDLSDNYINEATLLKIESNYWKNLSFQTSQLEDIIKSYNFVKARKLSKEVVEKMIDIVEGIIFIENAIIDLNPIKSDDLITINYKYEHA